MRLAGMSGQRGDYLVLKGARDDDALGGLTTGTPLVPWLDQNRRRM